MPRYRNNVGTFLNYSDSGGPLVAPGEEFEHDIPAGQLAIQLKAGFISEVPAPTRGRTFTLTKNDAPIGAVTLPDAE